MALAGSELTGLGSVLTAQGAPPQGSSGVTDISVEPGLTVTPAAPASGHVLLGQTVVSVVSTATDLAALDASDMAPGSIVTVLNIGNGRALDYKLLPDARAADGVLRVPASGTAGYLWIAGDGEFLPVQYVSPLIDFTVTSSGAVLVPAFTDFNWVFVPDQWAKILWKDTNLPATSTGEWNIGNDPSFKNVVPLASGIVVVADFNTARLGGNPFTTNFECPATAPGFLDDLFARPIVVDVTTPVGFSGGARATGFVLVSGFLTSNLRFF